MRTLPSLAVSVALTTVASACAALHPFRLDDQVALFHDDMRWGRMPAAIAQIVPSQRRDFERRHASWGRDVRIIDIELEAPRSDGLTGTARARYVWLGPAEVATRETVVETRWRAGAGGSWICDDEQVVSGDPTLLRLPSVAPTTRASHD